MSISIIEILILGALGMILLSIGLVLLFFIQENSGRGEKVKYRLMFLSFAAAGLVLACGVFTPPGKPGGNGVDPAATITPWNMPETQGHLKFPYRSADAGNYFLLAGEEITITWVDAPPGADDYRILVLEEENTPVILGEAQGESGETITVTWRVPAYLSGRLEGAAEYPGGAVVRAGSSPAVFSGAEPPPAVCTASPRGTGGSHLYERPQAAESFAFLIPGRYVEVLEKNSSGWLKIDLSLAVDWLADDDEQGTGWLRGDEGIDLFGPCDEVPVR